MPRLIACPGSFYTVAYALTTGGSPGRDFVDALTAKNQARVLHLFRMMAERGKIFNTEQFKKIGDTEFFEFKDFQIRIPCYFLPGRFLVVTHGFIKKTGRIPPCEIDRATRIKMEDGALIAGEISQTVKVKVAGGAKKPWQN